MVSRLISVVCAVFFSLAASTAHADGGKEEYEKAVKYSKAGEYEAALPLFKKAYELSGKRPSTILALAQCERALKIWDDAIAHFKEYLAVKPTPKDAKKVQETITLLEDIRSQQPQQKPAEPKNEAPVRRAETPPEKKPAQETPPAIVQAPPKAPEQKLTTSAPIREENDGGLLESPLFWIISGAVVLAAGGVAAGVALGGEPDAYGGTSGQTFRK